jgi:hypothetical protein
MVCNPIYYFLAPKGKYLEQATSSHPIKVEVYEIRPDFISLVRELNFTGGFDENPYKHLQYFKEICATLMISGMNHETLKWKTFLFLLTGWAKPWYKCHIPRFSFRNVNHFSHKKLKISKRIHLF